MILSIQLLKLTSYRLMMTLLFALLLLPELIFAQPAGTKPITKNGLIQALKIGGLSQKELSDQVTRRGVDFALNPDTENDLRHAGASGDLLKAVRENYHAEANPDSAAMAALDAPDSAGTPAPRPSPHTSAEPTGNAKHPLTLRDVRKLYIEKMPNGLDGYLRAAISRKLGSFFTIVLDRREADAILQVTDNRSSGTISMVDPSGKVVLWSGSADDKEKAYLNFRHGGERQVAEKLAGQLKKSLE
jgi:hypothetical protein